MNRDSFIEVHGVDVDAWTKRHGISQEPAPCPGKCGRTATCSTPIALGALRGLAAPGPNRL